MLTELLHTLKRLPEGAVVTFVVEDHRVLRVQIVYEDFTFSWAWTDLALSMFKGDEQDLVDDLVKKFDAAYSRHGDMR